MRRGERVAIGLLVGAALGVACALVGVLTTPTTWCDEVPQPMGQNLLDAGMVVTVLGGLAAAATLAWTAPRSYRLWLAWAADVCVFVAVVAFANHSSGGWGPSCG